MDRLKPSELRLLILFSLTLLGVGVFFGYDFYAQRAKAQKQELGRLEQERAGLATLQGMANEQLAKVTWLNKNQLLAPNELDAEKAIDSLVSSASVQAAGLERMDIRNLEAKESGYYKAFARSVRVQGELGPMIDWLGSLQSESSFRAITKLRLWPPKKQEPGTLQLELTVEQWYATETAVASSAPRLKAGEIRPEAPITPTGGGDAPPPAGEPAKGAEGAAPGMNVPAVPVIMRPEGAAPNTDGAPKADSPAGTTTGSAVRQPRGVPTTPNIPGDAASQPVIPPGSVATENAPGPVSPATPGQAPPVINQLGEAVPANTPGAKPPDAPSPTASKDFFGDKAPSGQATPGWPTDPGVPQPRKVILPPTR